MTIREDFSIHKLSDDRYGRNHLVEVIASALQDKAKGEHGCYTIGIYGPWGEGKTSVLNMLQDKLLETGKEDGIVICRYNPWMINNSETLIQEFFDCICIDQVADVAELLKQYGGIIAYAAGSVSTVLSKFGFQFFSQSLGSAAKQVDEIRQRLPDRKPLVQQKQEINDILRKRKIHLLVMIDDLDRLDKEELHAVFRLIRQVADFDNTTYVLAMDEHIVAQSVGDFYGTGNTEDGHRFLEKIVQVPIVLPALTPRVLRNEIADCLAPYMAGQTEDEKESLLELLGQLFSTKREVIRYANQLQFVYHMVGDEVNVYELCLLEAIKVCSPDAYQRVFENKDNLCGVWKLDGEMVFPGLDEGGDNDGRETAMNQIVTGVPQKQTDVVKKILEVLFPIDATISQNDCDAMKYIRSSLYFDRYFMQCVVEGYLSDEELDKCVLDFIDVENETIIHWVNEKLNRYSKREVWRGMTMIIQRQPTSAMKTQMAIKLMKCLPLTSQAKEYGYKTREDDESFVLWMTNDWLPKYIKFADPVTQNFEPDITSIIDLWEYWMKVSPLPYCMFLIEHFKNVLMWIPLDKSGLKNSMNTLAKRLDSKGKLEFDKYAVWLQEEWIHLWKKVDLDDVKAYFAKKIKLPTFDVKTFLEKNNPGGFSLAFVKKYDFCIQNLEKRIIKDYKVWDDDELLRNVVLNGRLQRGER